MASSRGRRCRLLLAITSTKAASIVLTRLGRSAIISSGGRPSKLSAARLEPPRLQALAHRGADDAMPLTSLGGGAQRHRPATRRRGHDMPAAENPGEPPPGTLPSGAVGERSRSDSSRTTPAVRGDVERSLDTVAERRVTSDNTPVLARNRSEALSRTAGASRAYRGTSRRTPFSSASSAPKRRRPLGPCNSPSLP